MEVGITSLLPYSCYTTCSGALNRLSELESRQYLMVKSQACITSGSKISSVDYYTINTYDNYSFYGIVGYWCLTSSKVSVFNVYPADSTHVCVGWKTIDGSAITDNTINVFTLYVYQSS